jgi:hypothetical protein
MTLGWVIAAAVSGHCLKDVSPPLCAKSGQTRPQQKSRLFDHRVGTGEQLPKRTLSEFAVVP